MRARSCIFAIVLLLSITRVFAAVNANAAGLTLDVHDADISDVITLLAAESGKNIVADVSMKPQRITLHLHDVSFEQALSVLVTSRGLQVRREGNILIIGDAGAMNLRYGSSDSGQGAQTAVLSLAHAKPDDIAKEIGAALPADTVIIPDMRTNAIVVTGNRETLIRARQLVGALDASNSVRSEDATVKAYHLHFDKADDVVKQLKAADTQGIFVADPRQNAVLVGGSNVTQREAAEFIASVDVASPQVMFEVKVADVTPQDDSSNFGLEFGGADTQGNVLPGATTYAFKGGSIPINVTLNALISKGRAQILATPKLVTLNNQEADLLIGETYPIVFNTSVLGGQNVQFVDIGVKLRLTPTIGPDGMVTAELHPEYSEILGYTNSGYPIIANRKIDSTLRVANNETIVLGGLLRDTSSETISELPGLADIPILGVFFKNKQTSHERDEIVFLITPHVIFPEAKPEKP